MSADFSPDHTAVISLARRPDRLAAFRERATLDRLPWAWTVFDAVDGQSEDVPPRWRGSSGAWGNAESHRRLLSSAPGDCR